MARKYSIIGDTNVEVSGYLKMDAFLDGTLPEDTLNIWKMQKENINLSQVVKIIYAPHHTLGEEKHSFSTFSQNYMKILEYAKEHPKTSWIYKPHPLLKQACIKNGLFKNEEEYDCYVREWENIPNGKAGDKKRSATVKSYEPRMKAAETKGEQEVIALLSKAQVDKWKKAKGAPFKL
ncbi:MAG: hypothetical protein H7Y17_08540 [Chlorobia bacterium]|nr:hypothetical protein [Fimbriimonadaceae bacterium]